MLIQADTARHEIFVKNPDGSTTEISKWWRGGPYGYLKNGETVEFDDWCTATRYGDYVVVIDPAIVSGPRPKRRRKARRSH